tara:strand:- start:154 stop:474 length:321 start_codon:yes stop_codon:yes gene_type:complete
VKYADRGKTARGFRRFSSFFSRPAQRLMQNPAGAGSPPLSALWAAGFIAGRGGAGAGTAEGWLTTQFTAQELFQPVLPAFSRWRATRHFAGFAQVPDGDRKKIRNA